MVNGEREALVPGPFAALEDYDVRHLVAHLVWAGRDRDVHRLLRMTAGPDSGNAWFAEKQRREGVGGFLADIAMAWELSSRACLTALAHEAPAPDLADEVRYALMTSSVNSLSRQLPPALLSALVRVGELPVQQALMYATQQPFAPLKAEAFALLSDLCSAEMRLDCLHSGRSAARDISRRPDWKVRALGLLAAHAPESLAAELVQEGLDVLRGIGLVEADENTAALLAAAPDSVRSMVDAVLVELPVTATKPIRPGVEELGGRPTPWTFGVSRFAELLPACGEAARTAALTSLRDSSEPAHAALALAACAGIDPALGHEALARSDSILEPDLRVEVLAAVASHLPAAEGAQLLERAATEGSQLSPPERRARALIAVAAALPDDERSAILTQAFEATCAVDDAQARSYLLRFLTPVAREGMLSELVTETARLPPNERGRAIAALATRVPRSLVAPLARTGQAIDDWWSVVTASVALARAAHAAGVNRALNDLLSLIIKSAPSGLARQVGYLAPVLGPDQFTRIAAVATTSDPELASDLWRAIATRTTNDDELSRIRSGGDHPALLEALRVMAEHAEPARRLALLREAWDIVPRLHDIRQRVTESVALLRADTHDASAAPKDVAEELVAAIRGAQLSEADQADAIASLVAFLPAGVRPRVVDDVLASIRKVLDEQRPWIDKIVPHLRPLEFIRTEYQPGVALAALMPWIDSTHYTLVLEITRRIRDESMRSSALHEFAEHVPHEMLLHVGYFDVAGTLTYLREWAFAHTSVLPLLEESERKGLVTFLTEWAQKLPVENLTMNETTLWSALAPYWDAEALDAALGTAARIADPWVRDYLTMTLVRALPTSEAIAIVTRIDTRHWRASALAEIAERPDVNSFRADYVAAAGSLGDDAELLPIASYLPDEARLAVLEVAGRELFTGGYLADPAPALEYLGTIPLSRLYDFWRNMSPDLTTQPREKVLGRLAELVDPLQKLWGEEAVPRVMMAIIDVARWWP
jgi:hypothetical protein